MIFHHSRSIHGKFVMILQYFNIGDDFTAQSRKDMDKQNILVDYIKYTLELNNSFNGSSTSYMSYISKLPEFGRFDYS